jgi:hypothetical protein
MTAVRPPADRHLLGVWNPSYAADAMDDHLRLLLVNIAEFRSGKLPEEEVYVFWGKVRSEHRLARMPHLAEILALDGDLDPDGQRELHLYLTDYRSLYVGHVYEITEDDVRRDEGSHVPAYYTERELHCDCWFRLGDIRRLVLDDTVAVIAELRNLRNTHYDDRPVSLYGGMVDLPLVVTREDGARYFDPEVREALLEGKYWAEADAGRTGLGAVERDLRENLFGADAWNALDVTTRTFIATAELVFRTHRSDAGFDFTPVVVDLAKAMELQANLIVRKALSSGGPRAREVNVDGRVRDIAKGPPLSLGQLGRVIAEGPVAEALGAGLRDGTWLTNQGAYVLRALAEHRNPAAHSEPVSRALAERLRNQLLGVGCHGDLVKLAGVRAKQP